MEGTVLPTFLYREAKAGEDSPQVKESEGAGTCSVLGSNFGVMSTPTRKWVPREKVTYFPSFPKIPDSHRRFLSRAYLSWLIASHVQKQQTMD